MKKIIVFLIFFLIFSNCSFDNKTGIWKDASKLEKKEKKKDSKLESVFLKDKIFEIEKEVDVATRIEIDKPLKNKNWNDKYFGLGNNTPNIYYNNGKYLEFKSSKLSGPSANASLLFYNNNIISSDNRGSIYVYSLTQKKKILEYNFYKKKFKKYKKQIYLLIDSGNIYASDNLGYFYVIEINSGKLLWAKNFGIPFRSNIKINDNKIFLANQDNTIYCLDKQSGEKMWTFATSLTHLKSNFINSIAIDQNNNSVIFLNTSGELYSIDYLSRKINWFLNAKERISETDSELFSSSIPVVGKTSVIFSRGNSLFNFDSLSGSTIWKKKISTRMKVILNKNKIFLFTKNNFLVCLDLDTGKVLWSKNIFNQIENLDKKKSLNKIRKISNLVIANNQIFLFSLEGYLLSFDYKSGTIKSVEKILKPDLRIGPVFANGNMYFFDKNYRLLKYE